MFTFSNDSQTSFVNLWGSPWSLKSSKLSCEAQPPPPCPHPQFVWVPLQTFNRLLSTWANSNEFLLLATQTALIQIAPTSVRELETRGRMEAGQTEDRMCESGWSSMLIQNPWGLCGGKEKWNTGNMTNFKRNLDKSLSHHPKSHYLWTPSWALSTCWERMHRVQRRVRHSLCMSGNCSVYWVQMQCKDDCRAALSVRSFKAWDGIG